MTQGARPSGPEACTESRDVLILVASRGGIWFMTPAACSVRTRSFSLSGRPSICCRTAATICGTPSMSARLTTPPSTLTLATRGSRLEKTGSAAQRPAGPVLSRDHLVAQAGVVGPLRVLVLLQVGRLGQGGIAQDGAGRGDG